VYYEWLSCCGVYFTLLPECVEGLFQSNLQCVSYKQVSYDATHFATYVIWCVRPKNADDALYELPDHIKVQTSRKKTEDMLSNQMLSGIPEVDLGIEWVICFVLCRSSLSNQDLVKEVLCHLAVLNGCNIWEVKIFLSAVWKYSMWNLAEYCNRNKYKLTSVAFADVRQCVGLVPMQH